MSVELRVEEVDGDVLVVLIDGGLSGSNASELADAVSAMVDAGMNRIILDCRKLDYLSSMGIASLLTLHRRMAERGGDLKLAGVRHLVAEVLSAVRLDTLLHMYPDVSRARLAFKPRDEEQ